MNNELKARATSLSGLDASRRPEVPALIEDTNARISGLLETVSAIESRLNHAMRGVEPEPAPNQCVDKAPSTTMGETILELKNRITLADERLADVLHRLEI